ncbi:gamma-soluble nsf attachment protein [Limosa lapponica baueri]|uniref:Gamma-soluble nsf attachment protein n=1 Tax=Limosa lapponica baueri TaxID=1758121 RepID=A0A2I0U7I2_LIMLA|nr:gamma-soluble nsf attachment protein [Limosa lapponica baueri]
MRQPLWVTFISGATQTHPLDLQDELVVRNIRDHKRLVEEKIDLSGLLFIKSETDGLEWCHTSTQNDRLAKLPEVYEVSSSPSPRCITISPCSMEAESEEGEESSPPEAMGQVSPLPATCILATSGDLPTKGTEGPRQKSIMSLLWDSDLGAD